MMVPAFLTKAHPLSRVPLMMLTAEGMWYGGSSMMNGVAAPERDLNFFRMIPEIRTQTTPMM